MTYTALNTDEQSAVHANLLRQYEAEHIRLSALLVGAEAADDEATIERLAQQVKNLDDVMAVHRDAIGEAAPTTNNRALRRAAAKDAK